MPAGFSPWPTPSALTPYPLAQPAATAGHPAVLDLLLLRASAPDGDAGQAGADQSPADVERPDRRTPVLLRTGAVYLGIVYTYVPFMILPLYATLEKLDLDLMTGRHDLGADRTRCFAISRCHWPARYHRRLPAGVHSAALGEYVIPALLGGLDSLMIGRTLYDEFSSAATGRWRRRWR